MKVHEFEAVVGGGEGRLPLVELPFDVKEAYGTARPKVKATVNDVTLRTTVSVYGRRSYVGFRKEIKKPPASGSGIGSGSGSSPTSSLARSRCPTTWPGPSGRIEQRAKRSRGSRTPIARNMPSGSKTPRSPRPVSVGWTRRSRCSGLAPSTPERPLRSLSALIRLAGRHCILHQAVAASPPWLATFSAIRRATSWSAQDAPRHAARSQNPSPAKTLPQRLFTPSLPGHRSL